MHVSLRHTRKYVPHKWWKRSNFKTTYRSEFYSKTLRNKCIWKPLICTLHFCNLRSNQNSSGYHISKFNGFLILEYFSSNFMEPTQFWLQKSTDPLNYCQLLLPEGRYPNTGGTPLPPQGEGVTKHIGDTQPHYTKNIFSQYMIRYGILSVPNAFLDHFQAREVVRNDLGHDSDDITRKNFFGPGGGVDT